MRISRSSKAVFSLLVLLSLIVAVLRYRSEYDSNDTRQRGEASARVLRHPLLIGEKMDVNTATVEDFALLPGIGKIKAIAIVKRREEMGGFECIEDLRSVDGIGAKTSNELDKWLRFDKTFSREP